MLVLADSPLRRALWTGPWPSPRLVVALRLCNELKNYVWRVFAPPPGLIAQGDRGAAGRASRRADVRAGLSVRTGCAEARQRTAPGVGG